MGSLVHSSMRQYAVISLRSAPACERWVIAYPDEKTLRDLLPAPIMVAPGYGSRELAQTSIDRATMTAHLSTPKSTSALAADRTRSLKEFVADHLPSKGKFSLAKTQSAIWRLLQCTVVAATVVFYSRNMLSTVIRALISF